MKKTILLSAIFTVLAFVMIGTSSCKKYKSDPAELIVGDYVGFGTDANENPLIGQVVRVTKISNKRVKVEPVGNSNITAFEIDIEGFPNSVSSIDDSNGSLAAQIEDDEISLSFSTLQEETFAGSKQ